jgi:hypothetical protein
MRAESRILDRIVAAATIRLITHHRMFQPREMHADLMCPSRLELNIEQRETIERTSHAIERQRIASATHDRHARAIARIARERLIDLP